MTAKEVNEELGKLISEAADDAEIVHVLNTARLKMKDLENERRPLNIY